MQRYLTTLGYGVRRLSQASRSPRDVRKVNELGSFELETFRNEAFTPQCPAVGRVGRMPAVDRWFAFQNGKVSLDTDYLTEHGRDDVPVALEITSASDGRESFETLQAPLSVFCAWTNASLEETRAERIYLAQHAISDLPARLQGDLPTPAVVKETGQGDVYGSSIWIGIAPTNTPLHRDPNPNLLLHMAGEKVVRLYEPELGGELFAQVQSHLGSFSSSKFRGAEMMAGEEKQMLDDIVWNRGLNQPFEVRLRPEEALFIPKGWWHSVKSVGSGVTASVNWWFR